MKTRKIIILALMALFAGSNLFANINVNVNLKRPLPPLFSTWRNDPSTVQVIMTATQNYSQVRISFTITDLDKYKIVVKTKDDNPAMPRFNLSAGVPIILNGNQIIKEQALDIDPTIQKWSVTTQMLPEGYYEFCVKILDINGTVITTTGVTCRTTTVTIPDPPVLISPTGGVALDYSAMLLPQFIWSPVSNPPPGTIISYLLKLSPVFSGQDDRTALENNTPMFNKLLQTGRISYQYMPSDIPFSRYPDAVAYVWQIQALDANNLPATRNDGKSEIGKFLIGSSQNSAGDGYGIKLISPDNNTNVPDLLPKFTWARSGKITSYLLKIAKVPINTEVQAAFDNPANLLLSKTVNNLIYDYTTSDPVIKDSSKDNPILGYAWQISANVSVLSNLNANRANMIYSETWFFTRKLTPRIISKYISIKDINCNVAVPTVTTPSTKTYHKDDNVKIGEFQMTFSTEPAADANNNLTGDGNIAIPFLKNIKFAVSFTGLQINTSDEVISGFAQTKMTDGLPAVPEGNLSDDLIKQYTDGATGANSLSQLQNMASVTLPIGIDNVVKSSPFVLAITSGIFAPNGAIIEANLRFKMPGMGNGADLCFDGKVCIKPDGFGDNKELYLSEDFAYPKSGDSWTFTFKHKLSNNSKGTYISFDKDGFHELDIDATVQFPRAWFVPAPDDNSNIHFDFKAAYSTNSDLVASCNIPNFSPACLKDVEFNVKEMYIDLASASNPSSITFPDGYTGDKTNNWQGFHISKATFKLPAMFKSSNGQKLSGDIHNMIIDKSGFTGTASVLNLLDLNLGGFSASIDSFNTQFLNSSFKTGNIKGKLKLPISDDELKYSGTMAIDNSGKSSYSFNVSTASPNGLKVPMWVATFFLEATSQINITSSAGEFKAEAIIHASITIDKKVGPIPVKLELMRVDGLKISQDGCSAGVFKLGSPQKTICGYDLSAANISLVNETNSQGTKLFGLQFDIKTIDLFEGTLHGSTKFTIFGVNDDFKFKYHSYRIDNVHVQTDLIGGLINLNGDLSFYDDIKWGDGFRGNVKVEILKEIKGDITVQFGSKLKSGSDSDRYNYWYVDASIESDVGMPIASVIGIYGFGGGAYYNMKPTSTAKSVPKSSTTAGASAIGTTSSGAEYVPSDPTNGTTIGFKAMVLFGMYPEPFPLNGTLGLDITLQQTGKNKTWAVNQITLTGQAYLCAPITDPGSNLANGSARIKMDFEHTRFSGDFNIDFDVADILKGHFPLNILADADSNIWHVYVGTWDNRADLKFAKIFDVKNYFMIGNDLPGGLPPFPDEVKRIFSECGKTLPQVIPSNHKMTFAKGDGISLGESSEIPGQKYTFLIFYAYLAAGLGFDVNLHNYGNTSCENSSGPIGINGWYANGQAYAYVAASIGLHIDVWFTEGDFEIISGGFAAILQAGLPNPFYASGAIAGYYSLLDGLITGHCSFEFDIGTQCKFSNENPLAIGLISDMQPIGKDVSPFVGPVATFNFPINQRFDIQMPMEDDGSPGPVRTFKVILDEKTLKEKNNGTYKDIEFDSGITDEGKTLALTPKSVIDFKDCKFNIKAHGMESINNIWSKTYDKKGNEIKADTTVDFTTGHEPPFVPDANESYSFPGRGQRFFIADKSELKDGYIVMKEDQDCFEEDSFLDNFPQYKPKENYTVDYVARFNWEGNKKLEVPLYHKIDGHPRVEFDITHLKPNTVYNVQVIAKIRPKVDLSKMKLTNLQQKIVDRKTNITTNQKGDDKPVNSSSSDNGKNLNKNIIIKDNNLIGNNLGTDSKNNTQQDGGNISKNLNMNGSVHNINTNTNKFSYLSLVKDVTTIDKNKSVIDTTKYRKIDVSAMKTLQKNEKLLFKDDLYFRTSKFTSLTDKINSYNYNSDVVSGTRCIIKLNIKEPFDKIDIYGKKYSDVADPDAVFGPFVKFEENTNTDWYQYIKWGVYDRIDGNSHYQWSSGGTSNDIQNPFPYWLNLRQFHSFTGCGDCDNGHYILEILNELDTWNQRTIRNKLNSEHEMVKTYFSEPFKSLNEAVSYTSNETSTSVRYNAPEALSEDLPSLYFRLLDRVNYYQYIFNALIQPSSLPPDPQGGYYCLEWAYCYFILFENRVLSNDNLVKLYFQTLNMTQLNATISKGVVNDLRTEIYSDYLSSDKQKMFGPMSFLIKGYYPPTPSQYDPEHPHNWNYKGSKTISFDVP